MKSGDRCEQTLNELGNIGLGQTGIGFKLSTIGPPLNPKEKRKPPIKRARSGE